jgi:CheY-like chemotaxis protein
MPDKILLAEDSLTIQKVFELTFARSDVSLTMVDNGDDAIRMAQELRPDLVIADLSLPGKTGFEIAAALRSSEATKRIPVLLLSGTLVPFDEETYKRSGAKGVVFKPFETQALLDKVHDLIAAPAPSEGKEEPLPGDEPWDFSDVLESVEEDSAAAAVPSGLAAVETPPARKEEFLAGGGSFEGISQGGKVSLGEFDVRVEDLEPAPAPAAPAPAAPAPPPPAPAAAAADGEDELSLLDRLAAGDEIDFAAPPPPPAPSAPAAPPAPAAAAPAPPPPPPEEALPSEPPPGPLAGVFPGEEEPFLEEPFFGFESETCGTAPEGEGELSLAGLLAESASPPAAAPPPTAAAPSPAPAPPAAAAPPPPPTRVAAPASASATAAELLQREEFSARVREAVERAAGEAMEKVLWEWMDRLSSDFREQIRLSVESVAWDVIPKVAEAVIRDEIARLSDTDDESSPE